MRVCRPSSCSLTGCRKWRTCALGALNFNGDVQSYDAHGSKHFVKSLLICLIWYRLHNQLTFGKGFADLLIIAKVGLTQVTVIPFNSHIHTRHRRGTTVTVSDWPSRRHNFVELEVEDTHWHWPTWDGTRVIHRLPTDHF